MLLYVILSKWCERSYSRAVVLPLFSFSCEGKKLDALDSFHIYKEAKARNQINDMLMVRGNELLETIIQQDPYEGYTAP